MHMMVSTFLKKYCVNFVNATNPFHATGCCVPGNHQKTSEFLIFSGFIEKDKWHEIG